MLPAVPEEDGIPSSCAESEQETQVPGTGCLQAWILKFSFLHVL